jgi:hypothetical protein
MMSRTYKILHLPTATYLYRDPENTKRKDLYNFIYTQYEIDNGFYAIKGAIDTFCSRKQADKYIDAVVTFKSICKKDPYNDAIPDPFIFTAEDSEETYTNPIKEHFVVEYVK